MRQKNFKFEKLNRIMMPRQRFQEISTASTNRHQNTLLPIGRTRSAKARSRAPKSEAGKLTPRKARNLKMKHNLRVLIFTPTPKRRAHQVRIRLILLAHLVLTKPLTV